MRIFNSIELNWNWNGNWKRNNTHKRDKIPNCKVLTTAATNLYQFCFCDNQNEMRKRTFNVKNLNSAKNYNDFVFVFSKINRFINVLFCQFECGICFFFSPFVLYLNCDILSAWHSHSIHLNIKWFSWKTVWP